MRLNLSLWAQLHFQSTCPEGKFTPSRWSCTTAILLNQLDFVALISHYYREFFHIGLSLSQQPVREFYWHLCEIGRPLEPLQLPSQILQPTPTQTQIKISNSLKPNMEQKYKLCRTSKIFVSIKIYNLCRMYSYHCKMSMLRICTHTKRGHAQCQGWGHRLCAVYRRQRMGKI